MHEQWSFPAGEINVNGSKVELIVAKAHERGKWNGRWNAYRAQDGGPPVAIMGEDGPFDSYATAAKAARVWPDIDLLEDPKRNPTLLGEFIRRLHDKREAWVMEMGTKRSNPEVSTMHREWAAPDAQYVCTDIEMGIDVDVAVDAHALSSVFTEPHFDAVISVSVFEHLQRPWIAAAEIAKILKPGGEAFIYTHFAFPVHGYPCDYFRFTKDGLETIFADAGLEIIGSDYENRAWIRSAGDPLTETGEAYTGVRVVARKPQSPNQVQDGVPVP